MASGPILVLDVLDYILGLLYGLLDLLADILKLICYMDKIC